MYRYDVFIIFFLNNCFGNDHILVLRYNLNSYNIKKIIKIIMIIS